MRLLTRLRCWIRNLRMETDWRVERARDLNEQQIILTESSGNYLADRFRGIEEERR